MTPAVIFREGHSGHYFATLVAGQGQIAFRVPETNNTNGVYLTHTVDYETHSKTFSPLLRILPHKKVYNAVYNIFVKKMLIEEYPHFVPGQWHDNRVFWYDRCYYNIKEFYNLIKDDIKFNVYPEIINFDLLTDSSYVEWVLDQYFNIKIDTPRLNMIKHYRDLQLGIDLIDDNHTEMTAIIEPISDSQLMENPWFWAYSIFKFEHNNNLSEHQRLWSVDKMHNIAPTKKNLLDLSRLYLYNK
jgi:hypothetical protein